MIISNNELIKFFISDIYPVLEKDEVLFISLSSRTKYLTEFQKNLGIAINRKEMFHRRFFSGDKNKIFEKVLNYLKEIKIEEDVLTGEDELSNFYTPSGHNIPLNTVTCYININPSSMIKAYHHLTQKMDNALYELVHNDNEDKYIDFLKLQNNLNTEVQKAKSRRVWIDIDFDVDNIEPVHYFLNCLGKYDERIVKIKTHSGYHVMLRKDYLKEQKPNLGELVNEVKRVYETKEVIINSNAMIPLPGTFQGGKEVKLI